MAEEVKTYLGLGDICFPLFFRGPKGGEVLGTEDTMSRFGLHFPTGTWALMSLFSLVHTV